MTKRKRLQQRLTVFSDEHQRLVGIALHAYAAIKTGNVGLTGSTGTLLYSYLRGTALPRCSDIA